MKRIVLVLASLIFAFGLTHAQTSEGGRPVSFQTTTGKNNLSDKPFQRVELTKPNLTYVQADDLENDSKGKPYRIGVNIGVNYNTSNSGTWTTLANGDQVWRLSIRIPDALALGLYFHQDVVIPSGAKLFAYNGNKKQVLGAYTSNTPRFQAMEMVEGELLTLEYYAPAGTLTQPTISISEVVYFYRGVEDHVNAFKDVFTPKAGSCQVDVACTPERNGWVDQINSVVHYTFSTGGGTAVCTAATINNTALDCKPYILTAWHCGERNAGSSISTWVWYWNYQKSTCAPNSNGTNPSKGSQTMTGGNVRASSGNGTLNNPPTTNEVAGSDFYLVELNSAIPQSYNAYYAGWDRSNTAATSGVGIHHPAGSAKKISTYTSTLQNATYNGGATNAHWRVVWAATTNGHGVTEGGSSGSPIFNQSKRIVGQLSGGSSFCNATTQPDLYGKMFSNWDQNGTANNARLKPWLDPTNSGVTTLDGTYAPCSPQPPVADFVANQTNVLPATTVNFTDLSTNSPTAWTWAISPVTGWAFAGGSNANSQNPQITFNTVGQYTVTLTASNAQGSDSETKTNYIIVSNTVSHCAASATNSQECDEYISNVTLGSINNTTSCSNYSNFTAQTTTLNKGQQYTITVNPRIVGNGNATAAYNNDEIAVWIDYNNDGVFANPGERVGYVLVGSSWSPQMTFTVPTTAVTGAVRMRCRISYQPTDGAISPCGTSAWGEVEDYTVNIQAGGGATQVSINCGTSSQTLYASNGTTVPNYVLSASASTNCTGGATTITQSPAAGSQLSYGNNTVTLTATNNCGNSSSCTINVNLVNNLSISENFASLVNLYPNPTSGNVYIDLSQTGMSNYEIGVYDLSGKLLISDKFAHVDQYELDLSSMAAGLYQIRLVSGDAMMVSKISKH
jgi:lysyl endopeptidase